MKLFWIYVPTAVPKSLYIYIDLRRQNTILINGFDAFQFNCYSKKKLIYVLGNNQYIQGNKGGRCCRGRHRT